MAIEVKAFVKESEQNIYESISRRNVFDLHDPPPKLVEVPVAPPPMQIRLTGITTILGGKKALLMVRPGTVQGKTPDKEESFILGEGERSGPIWLKEVNERAGTVKLECEGNTSTLALEILKPETLAVAAATPPPLSPRRQYPSIPVPPVPGLPR